MMLKWIGAILILISTGGFGFMLATNHKKEMAALKRLMNVLDYMECELQFRMYALPNLCRNAALETEGILRRVFQLLANELEEQISPDVKRCMQSVLARVSNLPPQTAECLKYLGDILGRFDLEGQLKGLNGVRQECQGRLNRLLGNADVRIRSYQTLGLCAGAALVILLM